MATVNRNFVIKNGLEVDTKTLIVDATNDRVGIGITNPTATLHVVTTSTEQFHNTVYIGKTNHATSIRSSVNFNGDWLLGTDTNGNGVRDFGFYSGALGLSPIRFDATGAIVVNQAGAGAVTGTASQPLQITGGAYVSGNVGIGTTNPTVPLDISGTSAQVRVRDSSVDFRILPLAASSAGIVGTWTNHDLVLNANNIERVRIVSSTGNVGIGTLIPNNRLAVNGLITENPGDGVYYNVVTQRDVGLNANQIPLNQYLGQLAFIDQYSPSGLRRDGGGSDDLIVDSLGRIGIGTTNPQSTLVSYGPVAIGQTNTAVNTAGSNLLRIVNNDPTTYTGAIFNELYSGSSVADVAPGIVLRRTRGTISSPSQILSGDRLGYVIGSSYGTSTYFNPVSIDFYAEELQTESARGSNIRFSTTNLGTVSRTEKVRITANGEILVGAITSTGTASQPFQVTGGAYVSGNVGVGVTNPNTKLDVVGIGQFTANGVTLNLIGSDHSYIQWFPDGVAAGRKGYMGWPGATVDYFTIENQIGGNVGHIVLQHGGGGSAAVLINTSTATGTASQSLQVNGGGYFAGNVGIATTNPLSRLHVAGGSATISFTETDAATDAKHWLLGANDTTFYIQAQNDLFAGGGNLFRFTRTGNQINDFQGLQSGVPWFEVDNLNKRVGIRTTTPTAALEVNDGNIFVNTSDGGTITLYSRTATAAAFPQFRVEHFTNGFGGHPVVELITYNGTSATPTSVVSGQILGGFNTWGHNGSAVASATRIEGVAEATFSTATSAGIRFATTVGGSQSERVRISAAGNVGIAHTQPGALLHISSSESTDANYLKVGGNKYSKYFRRVLIPAKSTAVGSGDTKTAYLGRFYNGFTILHIYVEGGYAEEGSEFIFHRNWGISTIPTIKQRSGSTHGQLSFHYELVDNDSYRVYINYTYATGNVLNETNTLRAEISSNTNVQGFYVESPTPTIPTLSSSNLMKTDFSIDLNGKVGIGVSNPTWELQVQRTQNSGVVAQIRNADDGAFASSILQLNCGSAGTKYTNFGVNGAGNYAQNNGAGGINTYYQDYDAQIFRSTSAGTLFTISTTSINTYQPLFVNTGARDDARVEVGSGRASLGGATWTASASTTVTITYNGHGFSNGSRVDLVFTASSGSNATSGNYVVAGATTNTFTITNPASITGSGTCTIGSSGNAYLDLITDTTYGDYGLRVLRANTGPNADSVITNKGSGLLTLQTEGAGTLGFRTNNQLRSVILSTGEFGIGLGDPTARLHVYSADLTPVSAFTVNRHFAGGGDNNSTARIFATDSGTSETGIRVGVKGTGGLATADAYILQGLSNAVSQFVFTTSGNVGIGTTNPQTKLHVEGAISVRSGSNNVSLTHDGTNGALSASGQLLLYASGTGNLILHTNNVQRLHINSIGNVGIGTNTPTNRLAVNGLITENPGDGVYYNVVTQRDVGLNANQIPLNQYLGQLAFIDQYSPSGLRRDGGGSDDLIVDANGRIGIGITNPGGQVGINTAPAWSAFNYGANLIIGGSRNNGFGILDTNNSNPWWIGNASGSILFATMPPLGDTTTGANVRVFFASTGNVGIGTTNPTFKLHIGPQNTSHLYLASGNNAFGWVIDTNDFTAGSVPFRIWRRVSGVDTESVTILNQSGNVGIGVTLPTYRLQVNGSFAATTKSFVIDHPTKPGFKLRYGSLEGPENGVYIRGKLSGNNTIEFPEYWTELVDEDSITVNLTPIGRNPGVHSVIDIVDNTIVIESTNDIINCFFTVFAERKDVDKLITEYES